MYSFEDKKHKIITQLQSSVLVDHARTLASGATLPLPQSVEGLNEIGQILGGHRQPPRNSYIGLTVTKPSETLFLSGQHGKITTIMISMMKI